MRSALELHADLVSLLRLLHGRIREHPDQRDRTDTDDPANVIVFRGHEFSTDLTSRAAPLRDFAGFRAPQELVAQLFLQMRRESFEFSNLIQIAKGQLRQEALDGRSRRVGVANQRDPDIVQRRPFRMPGDGGHDALPYAGFRQHFQHLAFGKERIRESQLDCLRMSFGENRARDTRGAAAGER